MRLLFVMDPLETMHPEKDTTFAFLRAAQQQRHTSLHCLLKDLSVESGRVYANARSATVSPHPPFASYGPTERVCLSDLDAVLIRKDPPFDIAYLNATQILDLVRKDTFLMNYPRGLRDADEKLFALRFSEWTPRTVVTSGAVRIREFVEECGGRAVIKPIGRAGGRGVLQLVAGDQNVLSIIDLLTDEGQRPVMVQEYLPAVRQGDKRVILLDGELLGAILRVPAKDDFRANIHVGGQVVACGITGEEDALIASVGPKLRAAGLYFVGLDIIGGRLTEVNVTSPTGIQELGRLTHTTPEDEVLRWLVRKVEEFGRGRTC